MKKDYMVSTDYAEYICDSLTDARKYAKILSIQFGYARINEWIFKDGDMVFNEDFEITYKHGIVKNKG